MPVPTHSPLGALSSSFHKHLMHLCPATRGTHELCHIPTEQTTAALPPPLQPSSHMCSVSCRPHIQVKQTLCPPHSPHKSIINASMHTHHNITATHAHTPKPLLLCTHKYHTLYLLRTHRTTDNPCPTHSIRAFKNIHRLCHTQYSLYIHTGTSP